MFGVTAMREIKAAVGAYAGGFDPALVSAADAARIAEDATAAENMLATVKALAAARVAETELWRKEGDASPAHHLARRSGTSVARAKEALDTARRLASLPEVDASARRGELSAAQAGAVADAAAAAPAAQRRLLDAAKASSLGELLGHCARTKAAALPDDEARHRSIHASRSVSRRRGADGAAELLYRSTMEEVAEVYAVVQGYAERAFRCARAQGRRERNGAYLADGLLHAARAAQVRAGTAKEANVDAAPTPPKVLVRVDWDALVRGWPIDGEVSEIAGLGPVAVSAIRAMVDSGDAVLAAVVTKGVDVATVAHLGRRHTAHQRSALEWRDPSCSVLGCNTDVRLENDHRLAWSDTKVTLVSLSDRICPHHHDLKTYQGWALVEGVGKRAMVAPDDPRHPANARDGPTVSKLK